MEPEIVVKVRAKGQGRKARDGAKGLIQITVMVTPAQKALIALIGGSVWVRKLIDDSQKPSHLLSESPRPVAEPNPLLLRAGGLKVDDSPEAKARAKAFDDSLFDDGPPKSPEERRALTQRALDADARDRNDPDHWKYRT